MAPIPITLKELNKIAREFGLHFEPEYPGKKLYPWAVVAYESDPTLRPILADRCEDLRSRWAEIIRAEDNPKEHPSEIYIWLGNHPHNDGTYLVTDCKRDPPSWNFQDRHRHDF